MKKLVVVSSVLVVVLVVIALSFISSTIAKDKAKDSPMEQLWQSYVTAKVPGGYHCVHVTHQGEYIGQKTILNTWEHITDLNLRAQVKSDAIRAVYVQLGQEMNRPELIEKANAMHVAFIERSALSAFQESTNQTVSTEINRRVMIPCGNDCGGGTTVPCVSGSPGCPYAVCGDPKAVCTGAGTLCSSCY